MTKRPGDIKTFVDIVRRALAGEITVRTWWGCPGLSGEAFRRWFLIAMVLLGLYLAGSAIYAIYFG